MKIINIFLFIFLLPIILYAETIDKSADIEKLTTELKNIESQIKDIDIQYQAKQSKYLQTNSEIDRIKIDVEKTKDVYSRASKNIDIINA